MFIVFTIIVVAALAVLAWVGWRRSSSREADKRSQSPQLPRPEVPPQRQEANHGIRSQPAASRGDTTPVRTLPAANQAGVTNSRRLPLPPPPARNTVRVVIVEVRPSGPEKEGWRPVTIERRELPQGIRSAETVGKAEARLCTEMQETVSVAAAGKIADLIVPAREPEAAAWLEALKSDVHDIMVGGPLHHLLPWVPAQGVAEIAQSAPLPGDSTVDTAEFVILAGGLLLGAIACPALYSASVKSLTHKVIADAADKAIQSAIDSALSEYRAPPPESPRHVSRAPGPATPPVGSHQPRCEPPKGRLWERPPSAHGGPPSSPPKRPTAPDDPSSAPPTPGRP